MPSKFIPRQRKHKRERQEQQSSATHEANVANAELIVPLDKAEKEERRQQIRAELKAQQQSHTVNSKKRKRLDKYIETKLRREENLDLLKKLAAHKVDTSLLQSAKKLGRVHESKRERFSRALREREAGLDVDGQHDSILFEHRYVPELSEESAGSEIEAETGHDTHQAASQADLTRASSLVFGSGLKRPLNTDDSGRPVLKRRKRRKVVKKNIREVESDEGNESPSDASTDDAHEGGDQTSEDSEWNGFSSNDEAEQDDDEDLISDKAHNSGDGEHDAETSSDSEDQDSEASMDKPARVSAFKAWADSQRNEALDFTPSAAADNQEAAKASFVARAPSPDPAATDLIYGSKGDAAYRPTVSVVISRSEDIQAARLDLPVVQDEQKIMEAITNNSVTVVCGATGSGKTTQLPQLLLENGYASSGMIGITQPRRVAAISVANRVAQELGPKFGKQVAHQVRYDSNIDRDTRIKFMTDGILLREISHDFALSKYSAIVTDEAHERSVNTDILIGMLSRIIPLRQELSREEPDKHRPLKLIIMSATLRVADFLLNERLFKSTKPPIVQAEGRQYQVTEHFARRTQRDYVTEMASKIGRGHRKLPPGSILVFLTGQDEIQTVAKRLNEALMIDTSGFQNSRIAVPKRVTNDYMEADDTSGSDSEADIISFDNEDDEKEFEVETESGLPHPRGPLKAHVLPLYAALPAEQQMRVFQSPPDGSRAIILATNVAETSLTIPGVRYVFDCGRSKEKCYDIATGVQEFRIDWISKASASQRMGRAGRTGPGHCYRLYSSAIYEQYFEDHSLPEILRSPIEGTVLQLKNMDVDNVVNFPFPTPPQGEQLAQAEKLLKNLGAIDNRTGKVTKLGQKFIHYPVNPRFAKVLLLAKENKVLPNMIAMVAGLAVGDLFLPEPHVTPDMVAPGSQRHSSEDDDFVMRRNEDAVTQKRKQHFGRARAILSAWDDRSDALKVLIAVALHAQAQEQGDAAVLNAMAAQSRLESDNLRTVCSALFLREKGMSEVQSLRRQLHDNMVRQGHDSSFKLVLDPPEQVEVSLLKQIVACGYLDQIAIRADLLDSAASGRKPRRANEVAYRTLVPSVSEADIDHSANPEEQNQLRSVFVHSSSVLAKLTPSEMPSHIVYSHLSRATAKSVDEKSTRTRMHPLTAISPKQLARLAEGTPLLEYGKPIGKIEDGEADKQRVCWTPISLRDPNALGSAVWPLGAWRVRQERKGKEWVTEKVLDRGK